MLAPSQLEAQLATSKGLSAACWAALDRAGQAAEAISAASNDALRQESKEVLAAALEQVRKQILGTLENMEDAVRVLKLAWLVLFQILASFH